MSARVRTDTTFTLDAGAEFHHHAWWYDGSHDGRQWGHGAVQDTDERVMRIVSTSPAALRALAEHLQLVAAELDQLYAEHGVEPAADQ